MDLQAARVEGIIKKTRATGFHNPAPQSVRWCQQTLRRVVCYARIVSAMHGSCQLCTDRVSFHHLVRIPFQAQSWQYRISSVEVSHDGSIYVIGTVYRNSDALSPQSWHPLVVNSDLSLCLHVSQILLHVMCLCSSMSPTCLRNWFLPLLINRQFRQEQFVGFGLFLLPLSFCLVHNL